jgi:hypothetical protein
MARDEALFLPIWYRYYARLFGAENLFIIDHNSGESPPAKVLGTATLNLFRIPFDTPSPAAAHDQGAFDRERFKFISNLIGSLLKYYETVIFNDTDEVFVPDPAVHTDLRAYLAERDVPVLAGVGIEIFHDPADQEAPFDLTRPVLAQRRHYVYRFHHSKPHILSTPCQIGGHGSEHPFHLDPDLYLMHLKYLDREETLRRQTKLHAFFRAGRGGSRSRWRFGPTEMERRLAGIAALRPAEGFAHHDDLARWLPGVERSAGTWTIGTAETQPAQLIQLTDVLPLNELRAAQAVRRTLPPRFADVQI